MSDYPTLDGARAPELAALPFAPFGLVPRAVLSRGDVSVTARLVWATLATFANAEHGAAYPSRSTLAGILAVSVDTIDRATRELVAAGLLERHERVDERGGTLPALYRLAGYGPAGGGRTDAAPPGRTDAAPGAARVRPNQTTTSEGTSNEVPPAGGKRPSEKAEELADATASTLLERVQACGPEGAALDAKVAELERTLGSFGKAARGMAYRWLPDAELDVVELAVASLAAATPVGWLTESLRRGAALDRSRALPLEGRTLRPAAPRVDPAALDRYAALRERRRVAV